MYYKTELHCHTSEVSRCAHENAADTVKKYVDAGYSTVVLTNHISAETKFFCDGNDAEGIEHVIDGYHVFRDAAEGKLIPLFGGEICLRNRGFNDYLVFGLTEEFLRANTDILDWSLHTLHEKCKENGMLVVQAHPFRPGMTISKAEDLDGVEVFNGHRGHQSHNDIADRWANYYHLIKTSGTDHHDKDHDATCGILTKTPLTTSEELIAMLKTNDYRLLRLETPELTKPHNFSKR